MPVGAGAGRGGRATERAGASFGGRAAAEGVASTGDGELLAGGEGGGAEMEGRGARLVEGDAIVAAVVVGVAAAAVPSGARA